MGTYYQAENFKLAKQGVRSKNILKNQVAVLGDQPTAANRTKVQSQGFLPAAIWADAHVATSNNGNCGSWAQAQAALNRCWQVFSWTTQDVHNSRCWKPSTNSLCLPSNVRHRESFSVAIYRGQFLYHIHRWVLQIHDHNRHFTFLMMKHAPQLPGECWSAKLITICCRQRLLNAVPVPPKGPPPETRSISAMLENFPEGSVNGQDVTSLVAIESVNKIEIETKKVELHFHLRFHYIQFINKPDS